MELELRTATTKGPSDRFTGEVWVDVVAEPRPEPSRLTAGMVRFAPGSRTAWHVHARGQALHVTDGVAIVQTRDGETVSARPGQTVYTPPGEWHWHGATADNFMSHLALSELLPENEGATVTWGEHVTDDEYRRAQELALQHDGETIHQEEEAL